MAHVELSVEERRRIERLRNARVPVAEISARFGCHRSTVYRELARNRFTDGENPYLDGYYGMVAQSMAATRRHRRRKLVRFSTLRSAVEERLRVGWTPEQIAGRMRREHVGAYVCHGTIYAWVYSQEGRERGLARLLPSWSKRRRVRLSRKPRAAVFPQDRSIHQRPERVASREGFSH